MPLTNRAQNLGIYNAMQLFEGAGHTLDGNLVLLDSCFTFFANELAGLVDDGATTSVNDFSNTSNASNTSNTSNSSSTNGANVRLLVYPNPATSASTVVVSGVSGYATVRIVDVLGRVVAQPFEGEISSELRVAVPLLASGNYYVVFSTTSAVSTVAVGLAVP